ncbi:hypothetical protein GGR57DRAFT_147728 [Xylariaceae sp. FL1272]|nr:hypothetical protein GGR57DRAFT_147728 [Xylariaceae sp. FL1272]
MSSRGNTRRGGNRNSELSEHGEEVDLWKEIKESLPSVLSLFNASSANQNDQAQQDKSCFDKKNSDSLTHKDLLDLDATVRAGVKVNEDASKAFKDIIEKLRTLRAVVLAKEKQQQESTGSRSTGQRPARDVYDFAEGDSPMPSPQASSSRRAGGGSKGERGDSVPPKSQDRSTPVVKAGSAEPQPGTAAAAAANAMRSKQTFTKDDEVAFKPKPVGNEPTEWILGIVQDVRGDGKSRRYRVLDADVDEHHNQKDFRTSASSMILIPKEGTKLPPLEEGKVVLALYPATTTFYKAEVIGMDGSEKVNLKFEGEDSSNTVQAVMRRHVVEYRA